MQHNGSVAERLIAPPLKGGAGARAYRRWFKSSRYRHQSSEPVQELEEIADNYSAHFAAPWIAYFHSQQRPDSNINVRKVNRVDEGDFESAAPPNAGFGWGKVLSLDETNDPVPHVFRDDLNRSSDVLLLPFPSGSMKSMMHTRHDATHGMLYYG